MYAPDIEAGDDVTTGVVYCRRGYCGCCIAGCSRAGDGKLKLAWLMKSQRELFAAEAERTTITPTRLCSAR